MSDDLSGPEALAIARSMLSLGMLPARAASTATRNLGLNEGSGDPPSRTATVIAFESLPKFADFFASCDVLRPRLFFHFECPAIGSDERALLYQKARMVVVIANLYDLTLVGRLW